MPRRCTLQLAIPLVLLGATGCAHLGVVCPGDAKWNEVTTEHFVLDSDLPLKPAAELAHDLEDTYAILDRVAFEMRLQVRGRVRVVQFADRNAYHEFGALWTAGEFRSALGGDPENIPTLVSAGEPTAETRATFRHELVHRFVAFHYQNAPAWLNEGLAVLYSTVFADKGFAYLGDQPLDTGVDARLRFHHCERREVVPWACFIPTGKVPALATMNAMTPSAFYASGGRSASDSEERFVHYAAAWGWVHLLRTGPENFQERFTDYLAALARGESAERAYETTLAHLDPKQLEAALHQHHQGRLPMLKTPQPVVPTSAPNFRKLSAAEAHVLFAKLGWSPRPEGRALASGQIAEALTHDPAHVEARVMQAWLAHLDGHEDSAQKEVDAVLAQHPDHSVAMLAKLAIETPGEERPFTPSAGLEEVVKRLRKTASGSHALNGLAWYYALTKRPELGLAFSRRSLEAEPSCGSCWDTYANLLAQRSQYFDAAAAQRRAANFLWPGPTRERFEARAKEYELLAAKTPAAAHVATSTAAP